MKTVLVTGPIGSGKSETCRYLVSLGYPVYDCDSRTKRLYAVVPGLRERIEEALGIEWAEIASVFGNPGKLAALEEIVYPYVVDDIRAWKEGLDSEVAFIESAVALWKSQFDDLYDEVLLVLAPYGIREARNPRVAQRDALQKFDGVHPDFVIENDSTIENLHSRIDEILCKLT